MHINDSGMSFRNLSDCSEGAVVKVHLPSSFVLAGCWKSLTLIFLVGEIRLLDLTSIVALILYFSINTID